MQITQHPYDDQGERDEDGYYGRLYSGVVYRFAFPNRIFVVRR